MTVQEMDSQTPQHTEGEGQECQLDEALHAGLTLILADAARSHLRGGDLEKAEC